MRLCVHLLALHLDNVLALQQLCTPAATNANYGTAFAWCFHCLCGEDAGFAWCVSTAFVTKLLTCGGGVSARDQFLVPAVVTRVEAEEGCRPLAHAVQQRLALVRPCRRPLAELRSEPRGVSAMLPQTVTPPGSKGSA